MSLKAKPQEDNELDHIRATLSDMVGGVGETRSDVKALRREVRENQQEIRQDVEALRQETRQNVESLRQEVQERFIQQDKRFDQLELLIRQLIPNSSN